jgi:peptidoglycan/LPS O-acetylase OafA/YrhL
MSSTEHGEGGPRLQLANLPAFDGLRGLAVIAVFLFHAEIGWARGGFLGVSAFFTLSGFLITTLLLVEHRSTGRIDLRHFWARRARRLLPAAFVALGGIVLFGAFLADPEQLRDLRGDVFSALAYVANWHFVLEQQSYAEIFNGTPSPVLHFWSLAIEEQFYLVFPLLAAGLLRAGRGRLRALGTTLAALTVGSVALTVALGADTANLARAYYGTFTRAAELLVGALLAVVLITRRRPASGRARTSLRAVSGASFVAMLFLWSNARTTDGWLYDGGLALHALLVAAVLAEVLLPGPLATVLGTTPLRWVGRISYGVYLYHWPVFLWISPERFHSLSEAQIFLLRVALTLGFATVSFHLLERPVRLARRAHRWWPRYVAPIALAAIVVGAIVVKPSADAPQITFAPVAEGAPPQLGGGRAVAPGAPVSRITAPLASRRPDDADRTAAGGARDARQAAKRAQRAKPLMHRKLETARPLRVLVVGDSVGQTFGRGLELWGMQTGRAQVWNEAKYYCSLGRFAPRAYGLVDNSSQGCDNWGERWPRALEQFDPDVAIVLFTFWEMVARKPPGVDDYVSPGDEELDEWQLGEYTTAVDTLAARGAKVLWMTIPCTQQQTPDQRDLVDHLNEVQIPRLAQRRPNEVRVVDLHGELCPDDEFRMAYGDVPMARPDGAHFSDEGAQAAGDWLMRQVLDG